MGVRKSIYLFIFFLFNDVKSPEKFNHYNEFVEKCLIVEVLAIFSKKSPILGALLNLKLFFPVPLNFSRQEASFKYPYDYILDHNFLTKKVAELVETQEFCHHRLNHSFFKSSYSHTLIRCILSTLVIFGVLF